MRGWLLPEVVGERGSSPQSRVLGGDVLDVVVVVDQLVSLVLVQLLLEDLVLQVLPHPPRQDVPQLHPQRLLPLAEHLHQVQQLPPDLVVHLQLLHRIPRELLNRQVEVLPLLLRRTHLPARRHHLPIHVRQLAVDQEEDAALELAHSAHLALTP
jgi:hypothetical protein